MQADEGFNARKPADRVPFDPLFLNPEQYSLWPVRKAIDSVSWFARIEALIGLH